MTTKNIKTRVQRRAARLFFLAIAAFGAFPNAMAVVSLDWGGQDFTAADGATKIPVGALWALVADTAQDGFGMVTNGGSLSINGSPTVQVDDLILQRGAVDSGDGAGKIGIGAVLVNATLGNPLGWSAGDPLALLWFPTYTTLTTVAVGGDPYGMFRTDSPVNGAGAWITPSDGITLTLDPLFTMSAGGSQANSLGAANGVVADAIPEPSAMVGLALGAGALMAGMARRKRCY